LPSHASILTGRWHHELSTDFDSPLDATYPTLAAVLGSRGYATGAVVANLRYCGYETGLDRGFGHYNDYPVTFRQLLASSRLLRKVLNNFRLRRLIENDQHLSRKSAEMVNDAALDWLGSVKDHPYFLFLNYFDAHEPYLPPPPFDTMFGPGRKHGRLSPLHRWLWEPAMGHANMGEAEKQEEIDAYDGSIAHIDAVFGALLDSLEERGLLANTMIIVTADHGEEFAEHRVYEHGYSLYRAGVQVPLVIVAPGVVPSGIRVPGPVSLRDIPTTVLDLLDMRANDPFPGISLADEWRPEAPNPSAEPILSQVNHVTGHPDWFPVSQGTLRSVTYRGLRYIRTGSSKEELFDFDRDTAELTNLIGNAAYDSTLTGLRAIVDDMIQPTSGGSR
jgi:arylsulfatase A-like enzyme